MASLADEALNIKDENQRPHNVLDTVGSLGFCCLWPSMARLWPLKHFSYGRAQHANGGTQVILEVALNAAKSVKENL